jgi:hypothetical protein
VRFLVRSVLRQESLCGREDECPDRVFRCRGCSYSQSEEMDQCPRCYAGWKQMDVSHGLACPKSLLTEALETGAGILVRRCFRLLSVKAMGITITLADITEEELQVMEIIEAERTRNDADEDAGAKSFQELLIRRLSRR